MGVMHYIAKSRSDTSVRYRNRSWSFGGHSRPLKRTKTSDVAQAAVVSSFSEEDAERPFAPSALRASPFYVDYSPPQKRAKTQVVAQAASVFGLKEEDASRPFSSAALRSSPESFAALTPQKRTRTSSDDDAFERPSHSKKRTESVHVRRNRASPRPSPSHRISFSPEKESSPTKRVIRLMQQQLASLLAEREVEPRRRRKDDKLPIKRSKRSPASSDRSSLSPVSTPSRFHASHLQLGKESEELPPKDSYTVRKKTRPTLRCVPLSSHRGSLYPKIDVLSAAKQGGLQAEKQDMDAYMDAKRGAQLSWRSESASVTLGRQADSAGTRRDARLDVKRDARLDARCGARMDAECDKFTNTRTDVMNDALLDTHQDSQRDICLDARRHSNIRRDSHREIVQETSTSIPEPMDTNVQNAPGTSQQRSSSKIGPKGLKPPSSGGPSAAPTEEGGLSSISEENRRGSTFYVSFF
ncbi:serine/arginine repetitive matrix protein 1-like [Macrobrachium nipponense]|uniref:serine/arginine repetitive matrix protein 1-like n=1 Tax=Macrobrachium nipponense TaxID=159736 RepID=UPI0030C7CE82